MPRPRELFETGDPVTADFTYIRWLGDRKAIEEITKVWNKLVIDRTAKMEEWMPAIQNLLKRRLKSTDIVIIIIPVVFTSPQEYSMKYGNE